MLVLKYSGAKVVVGLLLWVLVGVLALAALPGVARADAPVYVRAGGHDSACNGRTNLDYAPALAPNCAVQSAQQGFRLAQPGDTVVLTSAAGDSLEVPLPAAGEVTVAASPALTVTKTGSASSVSALTALTYTIRITNISGSNVTDVQVVDALPPIGVVSLSSITSAGSCGLVPGFPLITCTLGSLNAGANTQVTVVVTPTAAGTIKNSVFVYSSDPGQPEASVTTSVTGVTNLSISKADAPDPVLAGQPLTYTLTITNGGPITATSILVTDTLPASVQFNPASPNCSHSGGIVTCNTNFLGVNQPATFTFLVTPTLTGLITNTAQITGGGTDLDQSNNVTTQTTTVNHPGFAVNKSAVPPSGATVSVGSTITYTIVVSNPWGATTGLVLTDTIPAGTAYLTGSVSLTPALGTITKTISNVIVSVPNFPVSTVLTASFKVTVTGAITTITNQATLTSNQTSLQASNVVTHVLGGGPSTIYLPIILKNFAPPSVSIYWDDVEPVRDKVNDADAGAGLTPDGKTDGLFKMVINPGSTPKTVTSVRLVSSQPFEWDTIPSNANPVLGVFIGSATMLNQANGSINQLLPFALTVTLYGADSATPSRFPPDTYVYTVTVGFSDSTSVSASTSIPPAGDGGGGGGGGDGGGSTCTAPTVLATVTVGNLPRGVAVDTNRANRAYVANFGSSSVSVVQSNAVAATISGVTAANGIAYDASNDLIWVTNTSTNQVTPIQATAPYTKLTPIDVGAGPWGVAHNLNNNYVYVANRDGDSVTVINAATRAVVGAVTGSFNEPAHIDANPVTGKVYVTNFAGNSVTVIDGTTAVKVVSFGDSTQPYGITVDETRDYVYVATVDSHRIAVIGELSGVQDQFLGWAAFHRGFNDPARPVPLRVIDINPDIGPAGDGGHLWTTTSTNDGSEKNQVLLVPKGWDAYFNIPVARDVGANPAEGIAVDRAADQVYVTSGASPGAVTVLSDTDAVCLEPFAAEDAVFGYDVFKVE